MIDEVDEEGEISDDSDFVESPDDLSEELMVNISAYFCFFLVCMSKNEGCIGNFPVGFSACSHVLDRLIVFLTLKHSKFSSHVPMFSVRLGSPDLKYFSKFSLMYKCR